MEKYLTVQWIKCITSMNQQHSIIVYIVVNWVDWMNWCFYSSFLTLTYLYGINAVGDFIFQNWYYYFNSNSC